MKYLDGIKSEPKTELEAHYRWVNRLNGELNVMSRYSKKIKVKYVA